MTEQSPHKPSFFYKLFRFAKELQIKNQVRSIATQSQVAEKLSLTPEERLDMSVVLIVALLQKDELLAESRSITRDPVFQSLLDSPLWSTLLFPLLRFYRMQESISKDLQFTWQVEMDSRTFDHELARAMHMISSTYALYEGKPELPQKLDATVLLQKKRLRR